nr:hypothetical protein [Tanacetum cinerariifolium]
MVKDVTDLEIKNAMFEFFKTGKILKEINSTLIALIPKTPNPKLVTELRLIACCNVIYKCISKILTNRTKDSLNKLVNLNKSAFIQEGNIQDNILLTQELLEGYNRKGGSKRYDLKIDIAKAYDTIGWDFLRSILIKFGFHWKMVDWIMTYPISHYLFTLGMEVFTLIMAYKTMSPSHFRYHVGCKDLMLTHLCFADNIIVLCHGDKSSISIIKEALEEFSAVFGLKPNLSKSTIFFGNVNNDEQRSILKMLLFKVGSFPAKYLEFPLVTKRLGREDCKHLVDMASVFLLPKSIVKDIERVLKGLFWCQGDLARRKAKIAWKTLCEPKCQGVHAVEATDDSPAVPEHTTVETPTNMSPENKAHFLAEKEAIYLILTGIGDDIYSTVDACQTAREMWEAIERLQQEDNDPEQAQRDKDMQKNLALIAKYFKKIYKPTNNNLRTSSNSKNKSVDMTSRVYGHFAKECRKSKRVKDFAYHKEKMLLCKQAEQGVPLQAEQYDWLADTDEEVDKQELEAHYSYMTKIKKVPNADSGTDLEPVEQNEQNDVESDDERVALANLKLNVDENKNIQKQLKKANTTLAQELKECKAILAETSKSLGSLLVSEIVAWLHFRPSKLSLRSLRPLMTVPLTMTNLNVS